MIPKKNVFLVLNNVNLYIFDNNENITNHIVKKRARGFVNTENSKYMIYFVAGVFKRGYPHDSL